jgi:putative colanic acid biosysnthesis UDP-glucose lipid carrier transferase
MCKPMDTRSANIMRFSFPIFDLIALNLVFATAGVVVKTTGSIEFMSLFLFSNLAWLFSSYFNALYNVKIPKNERLLRRTAQSFFLYYILLLTYIFLLKYDLSRLFVISTFIGFGLCLLISRTLFIGAHHFLKRMVWFRKKIIILGYNDVSKKLVDHFTKYSDRVEFQGFFDDDKVAAGQNGHSILGGIKSSLDYAIHNHVSEIYSTIAPERNTALYDIAQEAERNFIRFKVVPDFQMFVNRKIHLDFARDIPIISLRSEPLEDIGAQIKKRCFDVIFSLFVIIFVLSWLIPLLAIIIKLDSRGPVFFVQPRHGKNNSIFRCIKFRSLKVNKEAHEKQVTRDDERFTRVGKFLRRTNLDELPQFINVLLGQMSVVGPRPHMIKHTVEYSSVVKQYVVRHFIKPGVTGWAQVNGYRGEIKEEQQLRKRIEHDIWYMEHWSMWLDLKIILLTFYATFKGDKNAF